MSNEINKNISKIKIGNDGNKLIMIKQSKWIKLYGTIKKYITNDNGAKLFKVVISEKNIIIFKKMQKKINPKSWEFLEWWEFFMKINKYKNVFVGKNTNKYTSSKSYGSFVGNSILIEQSSCNYIYVGHNITEFTTIEPIIKYYSPMGNNYVPYPFALTKNYVYLMLNMMYMKRIKNDPEPYASFYGFDNKYDSKPQLTKNKILFK